ncbi:hypothetical protein CEXT_730371 [Caerostris extrusa]|uniref:Uncharacterized protein n=1 Tax=Caerostris extrusa TaxID=172846 RepID=A0AAV4Q3Z5_CAEEX|nr:hypothetical protein CEXT_730371 [Caerostris extrusa]
MIGYKDLSINPKKSHSIDTPTKIRFCDVSYSYIPIIAYNREDFNINHLWSLAAFLTIFVPYGETKGGKIKRFNYSSGIFKKLDTAGERVSDTLYRKGEGNWDRDRQKGVK